MALVRHWYPTENKSYRSGTPTLIVIHTTEGFTGANGMYDCAQYFQGPVGASSHVVIDNYHPGHICECVSPDYASWTQCGYNGATASSAEQCGYASWSRDVWLNDKMPLLENTAAWAAEESARWGIPLTDLSASQAQSGGRGVAYHGELGPDGCGHSDPGAGYPLDVVLEMARGGAPETKPLESDGMIVSAAYWDGKAYRACVGTDYQLYWQGPDTKYEWRRIDPGNPADKKVKGGAFISIDPGGNGGAEVDYINYASIPCKFYRPPGGGAWQWAELGGYAV